jgi:hypothetical protein
MRLVIGIALIFIAVYCFVSAFMYGLKNHDEEEEQID